MLQSGLVLNGASLNGPTVKPIGRQTEDSNKIRMGTEEPSDRAIMSNASSSKQPNMQQRQTPPKSDPDKELIPELTQNSHCVLVDSLKLQELAAKFNKSSTNKDSTRCDNADVNFSNNNNNSSNNNYNNVSKSTASQLNLMGAGSRIPVRDRQRPSTAPSEHHSSVYRDTTGRTQSGATGGGATGGGATRDGGEASQRIQSSQSPRRQASSQMTNSSRHMAPPSTAKDKPQPVASHQQQYALNCI